MNPNLLLSVAVLSILMFACKKENAPEPQQAIAEKYSVTFSVSNIEQKVEDLPDRLTEGLGQDDSYINFLDFFVYDKEGELTEISQQEDWVDNFPSEFEMWYGEVHFNLEPGDYKLVVFGTEKNQVYVDSAAYSTAYLTLNNYGKIGDIFYKEVPFTVSGDQIIDTVHLDRIVGQLEIRLSETLDPIVKSMEFYLSAVNRFPFDPDNTPGIERAPVGLIEGNFIPYHKQNFVWRSTILPDRSGKFDTELFLTADGPKAFFYEQRSYKGVFVYPNKKTIVTGTLWDNTPLQNFYVDADSIYGEPVQIDLGDLEFTYELQ